MCNSSASNQVDKHVVNSLAMHVEVSDRVVFGVIEFDTSEIIVVSIRSCMPQNQFAMHSDFQGVQVSHQFMSLILEDIKDCIKKK